MASSNINCINLKKAHFNEYIKVRQLSKLLTFFKFKKHDSNTLFAEKLLLESVEKLKLIRQKICEGYDESFYEMEADPITVTNIKLQIKPGVKIDENEYFVVLLISGLEVKASKPVRPINNLIIFEEDFTFNYIDDITLKLYSRIMGKDVNFISLTESQDIDLCSFQDNIQISNLLDINSFLLNGEFSFNLINEKDSKFISVSHNTNKTFNAIFTFKIDCKIDAIHRTGFLTLGKRLNNNLILWDRKWCSLLGSELKMYNFPTDECFSRPIFIADLRRCQKYIDLASNSCPRSKTLLLLIDNNEIFLRADNSQDLKQWKHDLNLVSLAYC